MTNKAVDGTKDVVQGARACASDSFFSCLKKAVDNSDAFRWIPSCSSASSCKKKVTEIAKNAFSKTFDAARQECVEVLDVFPKKLGGEVWSGAMKVYNEAPKVFQQVRSGASEVTDTLKRYTKALPKYKKYDLGRLRVDKALFYMHPTDCGAFASLGKVFSDKSFSDNHFKDAGSKLKKCISLKGVMNIPTPFM